MSFAPPLFVALIERLAVAHNARVERRMSVQVSGLADTVRKAKAAIDAAGGAAQRLNDSATAVVNTIGKVDAMTQQLDAANRDLNDAVAVMSNGGPPLETTAVSASTSTSASPAETIDSSITKVQIANATGVPFPAGPTTPIAPTIAVTASTIAAANA